jgi:hypothetical protein
MHLDMIYRLREAMKGDTDIIASITTSCETFDVIMYVNNSVIMLPTKNDVDRPKTKSAIALTKIILKICMYFFYKKP